MSEFERKLAAYDDAKNWNRYNARAALIAHHTTAISERDKWIAELTRLLTLARCPDEDCQDGIIPYGPTPDGDWIVQQCQWCDERDAAMNDVRKEDPGKLCEFHGHVWPERSVDYYYCERCGEYLG